MLRTITVILGLLFALLVPQYVLAQQVWDIWPDNPLIERGAPGTWDDDIVEAAWVIHDGTEYLMYYTGRTDSENRHKLGLMTSPDGITWTRYGTSPILDQVPGEWDYRDMHNSLVIFDGTTYHMWYGGIEGWYTPMAIGYATSTDGRNWTRYSGNPVITPGPAAWDSWRVHPNTVLYLNGQFHMWYWGEASGSIRRVIGYAVSDDGIHWIKHPDPVLEPGPSGSWDADRVYGASVLWNGSEFEMWYTGQPGSYAQLGYATSTDGVSWQKHGPLGGFGFSRNPFVMIEEGQYRMWFNGDPCCIYYATSGEVCAGIVCGTVVDGCSPVAEGLFGVVVDAYESESGTLVASDTTDAAGEYVLGTLDTSRDYIVGTATPLGFLSAPEAAVFPECSDSTTADFVLECLNVVGEPRSPGFWKHEFGVATGGKGRAHFSDEELCLLLDDIEAHFNNNIVSPIVVYVPPDSGSCIDKLDSAWGLVGVKGNAGMEARAKRQLMAVLLNVTANYIWQKQVVTEDGATVSQAIVYCDALLQDTDALNDEMAKDIAEAVNHGQLLPAGMIPLDIPDIAITPRANVPRNGLAFRSIYPNPFNPRTTIEFSVAVPTHVRLDVYSVDGKLVRTLVDAVRPAGVQSVVWNGRDGSGREMPSGVYFARLEAPGKIATRKLVMLK